MIKERNNIINYYNKFCEDKRLKSRHGRVEFEITISYILKYLEKYNAKFILDVGAGTGAYSLFLSDYGYDVTAVELVNYNLGILKSKSSQIKAYQGDAVNLKKFGDDSFDVVLLLGPMYHLIDINEKLMALSEAKRVVKKGGLIFVAYCMKDYAIIKHGFMDGNFLNEQLNGAIDENFNIVSNDVDLYSYVTLEDINQYNKEIGLKRVKIFAPDGPSDYIRQSLNKMTEAEFIQFINYQKSVAERRDLLGASSHLVDVLTK